MFLLLLQKINNRKRDGLGAFEVYPITHSDKLLHFLGVGVFCSKGRTEMFIAVASRKEKVKCTLLTLTIWTCQCLVLVYGGGGGGGGGVRYVARGVQGVEVCAGHTTPDK